MEAQNNKKTVTQGDVNGLENLFGASETQNKDTNKIPTNKDILEGLFEAAKKLNENENPNEITGYKLLSEPIEHIPFLVENLIIKQGLCSVVGTSDCGKSTFLRQLAISIVSKRKDFLGFKINATHNAGVYVSTEDDDVAHRYLLYVQNKELNLRPEELKDLIFIYDTTNLVEKLEAILQRKALDFIIIDAFSDIFNRNLNQNNEVRCFLETYNNLAKKYKCAIIFLHHTGKRTEILEPSKNNVIGSQGYEAKMRLLIELRPDFFSNSQRHLCILKANYLPKEYKSQSFVLNFNENMIFSNTGERVNIENLAKNSESTATKTHKLNDIAEQVFSSKSIQYNEAVQSIVEITDKSDRTARTYIKKMIDNNLIENIGEKNKPEFILKIQNEIDF